MAKSGSMERFLRGEGGKGACFLANDCYIERKYEFSLLHTKER